MESELRIGEIAKKAGVGVQTLHYYERIGLLPKTARSASNYRIYSSEALRRVRFIKKAQTIGFSLAEIKEILDLKRHGQAPCRKIAELGEKHLREIAARCVGNRVGVHWLQSPELSLRRITAACANCERESSARGHSSGRDELRNLRSACAQSARASHRGLDRAR